MQDLIETYHNPLTQDNSVKIQDTRFEKYLNISIPDQLFKNQCTSVNNMFFKNDPMQQSTQNQVYQDENLINEECDQFTRSIDQNTELKVCLKSKNIQITVIQAQPDNMSAVMKEQKENAKRNNIKIYIEKIQNAKMDGYIKGLFYDVVSLFAHLKFTDQLQFMVVKNQKKIISLNDNKDMHLKKYQNQEYYQHFLNFYKHQILPGDRFVKRSCSIRLSKISTQQNKKELIKENKYKIQELKIQQLIAKNEQLQAKVKKYISENKGLQQNIQNLNKIIHFYENENQSQEQTIQIKRNQIQLHKHNHYYEEQEQKKDRKKRKRIKKQIQKNISMKRESQIMPIERMTKNIQDIQEEKKKKLEEQNFFQDENQFVIEKSIKENIRQHIQDQKILKKEEQANLHEIISQNIKKPLDFSFNNHKSMLKLNYQPKPNPVEFQLSEETQKHSKGNLNLINKHIELKESPRKIIISVSKCSLSVCPVNVQLFAFKVPDCINQELDINQRSSIERQQICKSILILAGKFILNKAGVIPLALRIKNNKNITEFIKILQIQHNHNINLYNNEFQPFINLVNKDLLKLQQVIVSYPNNKKQRYKNMHWTSFVRKEISVSLLGSFKFS